MIDLISFLGNLTPDTWAGAIAAGLATTLLGSVLFKLVVRSKPYVPGTEEYQERVAAQAREDAAAKQNNEVVYHTEFNGAQIKLFSGDITQSSAQVIVSSDDTLLSATGGVAKAVVNAAGSAVKLRLRKLSDTSLPRGFMAITDGGSTRFKYIFHAAVLTKTSDYTEYPSSFEIEGLVQRIVNAADAAGIESIALPLLAGGTASKKLKEQGLVSDHHIVTFLIASIIKSLSNRNTTLKVVFLIVFDNSILNSEFLRSLDEKVKLTKSELLQYV